MKKIIYDETAIECSDDTFEANYAIAQSEAVGEIIVEDLPDPPPTREDRIEAQVTFTAMMTDTLLPEEDEDDV